MRYILTLPSCTPSTMCLDRKRNAMSTAISGIIYYVLIRDRYDAKLRRLNRKAKREERRLGVR